MKKKWMWKKEKACNNHNVGEEGSDNGDDKGDKDNNANKEEENGNDKMTAKKKH